MNWLEHDKTPESIIKVGLSEKKRKAEEPKCETLLNNLRTLKNQLNSHFLFNTFSTLISLIPENQQLAEQYARNLSNVYRYILSMHNKELASIKQELEFVDAYMFMVSTRFENKVTLSFNIDEAHKLFYIPSFSLQILVENAIKHNIISKKCPLWVIIEYADKKICVKNNFQKKNSAENSTGIGLKNLISRYKSLCHDIVEVICTEKEFIVKLPILYENINQ